MVHKIGIDFGTTNSLISVVSREGIVANFDDINKPHPSVVRYEGSQIICGRKAKEKLEVHGIGVIGNTVRGPKKLLNDDEVIVDGRTMSPVDVVTDYIKYLINHAKDGVDEGVADFTNAVVTIPVALDGRGRQALREALLNAGVYVETFVHEPLAALYAYFKEQDDSDNVIRRFTGKTVLVFDWGGGTLDLTLCKIINGSIVQVLNRGNNSIGGDYIDEAILHFIEQKHAEQHGWTEDTLLQRNPGMKSRLLESCEKAKITLSSKEKTNIFMPDYYQGKVDESEIDYWLSREDLESISKKIVNKGIAEIETLLSKDHANVDEQSISLCLATGGMVNMPVIKRHLREKFGVASLHISKHGDRIISNGAAWIARDNLNVSLAKPFELLESRNSLLTIFQANTQLPKRGESIKSKQSMYCTDPRDGKALFDFKRPAVPGKSGIADPRDSYGVLSIEVNPEFPPFEERIEVQVTIDENLIANVNGIGLDWGKNNSIEYYDLEFALKVSGVQAGTKSIKKRITLSNVKGIRQGLIIRANVTEESKNWSLVPGELLNTVNKLPEFRYLKVPLTEKQRTENVRYQPCARCGSNWAVECC